MVFREPLVALLVGLVRRASAVEGDVVVVATVAPTTVALFAPTLLTFNVTDMVLGAEAFVKVIAPGGGSSCEAVPGVSDAISGGAAQLTYVSATQGTWSATLAAKPLPGYTVCYSETGGVYEDLWPVAFALTLVPVEQPASGPVAVLSASVATLVQHESTTITFVTSGMHLGEEAWVKVINSTAQCEDTAGASDAVAGGAAQLAYVRHTEGVWRATVSAPPATLYRVCYAATQGGAYAELTGGSATLDVTPPLVLALAQSAFPAETATTLDFAVVGYTGGAPFWVKIVPAGVACDAVDGASDALDGGAAAGSLTFVTSTHATLPLPALSIAAAAANVVCYCVIFPYLPIIVGPGNGTATVVEVVAAPANAPSIATMSAAVIAQFAPTTFTLTGSDFVDDASLPFVKVVPFVAGACSSVPGVADAVDGGVGRVTFASVVSVTWTATVTAASSSSSNWVCWSATAGGTYQSVTDGTVVAVLDITEPPAVVAASTAAVTQGASDATIALSATALVSDSRLLPWIKIISPSSNCGSVASDADAVGGAKGQVAFETESAASFVWPWVDAVPTLPGAGLIVCYAQTRAGVYSSLSGGAARVAIAPAVPIVQAYLPGTVNQDAAATLRFRAVYLANDTTLPWLKVIAPGGDCAAALGPSDAEGGGAGRLGFVSSAEAKFTWRNVGLLPGTFTFCYGATEVGAYAALDTPPGEALASLVVAGPIVGQPTVSALLGSSEATIVVGAAALFSVGTENVADDITRP